eukprot:scaffold98900_cov66-Phaeocystis_antarctica.AAC.3
MTCRAGSGQNRARGTQSRWRRPLPPARSRAAPLRSGRRPSGAPKNGRPRQHCVATHARAKLGRESNTEPAENTIR